MIPYTRVYAAVNLDVVEHNMKAMVANLTEGTGIMGVVKADGYGHGAVWVAGAIDPYVRGYAVATAEEAFLLRRHGISKPILILGVTHESCIRQLIEQEIRPTVFQRKQALALSRTAVDMGKIVRIHLALDTGMSRIGMRACPESADLAEEIASMPGICVEGLFTHFARADETDKTSARQQLRAYLDFVKLLEERGVKILVRHISNSAGLMEMREADCDLVRAGISIYGLYPSDEVDRDRVALRPAMELKSRITYVKTIGAGVRVSYGGTFVADRPMIVATVPIGYGDGYPRSLSGKGRVLIRGKSAPILGRVCMDQMMVDVTDISGAAEDDEVTLIGRDGTEEITVEELARLGGGFHYEIICGIGKRVPRVYIRDGKVVGKKDYFDDVCRDFSVGQSQGTELGIQ